MSSNDFVSVDELLAYILGLCADEDLRSGFSKGWYTSRIHDSLKEVSFNTFYLTLTKDIYNWDKNDDRQVMMPESSFNVKELYLFSGDCCVLEDSVVVHFKRQFNNNGAAKGKYTASRAERTNEDAFYGKDTGRSGNIVFGNIQNGTIMIQNQGYAESHPHLRVVYNGIPSGDINKQKIILSFFKEYIKDSVCYTFYLQQAGKLARQGEANASRLCMGMANEFKANMMGDGRFANVGSKLEAQRRASAMNTWESEAICEYLARLDA